MLYNCEAVKEFFANDKRLPKALNGTLGRFNVFCIPSVVFEPTLTSAALPLYNREEGGLSVSKVQV